MIVACPTRTPGTSVMALKGPGSSRPIRMPRSRTRARVLKCSPFSQRLAHDAHVPGIPAEPAVEFDYAASTVLDQQVTALASLFVQPPFNRRHQHFAYTLLAVFRDHGEMIDQP